VGIEKGGEWIHRAQEEPSEISAEGKETVPGDPLSLAQVAQGQVTASRGACRP
jgi:hypothetical protein